MRLAVLSDQDYQSARSLIDRGKTLKGFWLLNRALRKDPRHVPSLLLRGELLFNARRYRTARDDFLAVLEGQWENERASVFLGLIAGIYGQVEESKSYFERALDRVPQDLSVRWLLADCHFRLGEFGSALYHFKRILAVNACDTRTTLDIGYCHFYQGEFAGALHWFRTVLRTDPTHVDANLAAAKVAMLRGLPDHGRHFIRRVLRAEPTNTEALTTLAYLHYYTGSVERARELVDAALRTDSGHLPAILLLGGLEVLSGRKAQTLAQALGNLSADELAAAPFKVTRPRSYTRRIWLPLERPSVYQRS